MSSIPLPALSIRPPAAQPDPLEQYGRLMQLRNQAVTAPLQQQALQQQVATGGVDLQMKQQQLKDNQALTSAMQNWDGKDYNDIIPLATKNGMSAQGVIGLKGHIIDQQTKIATAAKDNAQATEANVNATKTKNDQVTGALAPLLDPTKTPDEMLPQALTQTVQSLTQQNLLDPQHQQKAQQLIQSGDPDAIRQGITQFVNPLRAQSQILEDALKRAQTKEAQYKVVNGTLMDMSGDTPKPAMAGQLNPDDWNKLVDSTVPASGANAALNSRTHSLVNFAIKQGNVEAAQRAITQASDQLGAIEKETNPQVQQNKINTAAAEGQARANVEAAVARGSNAALAQVPPHLVAPATAAATKAGTDYVQSKATSQDLQETLDAARKGNVISYRILPEEGALQVNTTQGVKRINMANIQNYAGGGSAWQKLQGHVGSVLSGKSIPDSVLNDMGQIQGIFEHGSQAKYENDLNTINQTYGAQFKPIQFQSTAATAPQTNAPKAPAGATHTAPGSDGKNHYTNDKGQDLGVAP